MTTPDSSSPSEISQVHVEIAGVHTRAMWVPIPSDAVYPIPMSVWILMYRERFHCPISRALRAESTA